MRAGPEMVLVFVAEIAAAETAVAAMLTAETAVAIEK